MDDIDRPAPAPEFPTVAEVFGMCGLVEWQRAAVIGRFKSLTIDARVDPAVVNQMIHDALHGPL